MSSTMMKNSEEVILAAPRELHLGWRDDILRVLEGLM